MSARYLIADVARRTGFSAATLRYYEGIGLLPAPERTPGGYRRYDEGTVERLAFIGRAKRLGCSLEEIADLLTVWDGQRCGPVQDRLRALVVSKIGDAQQRVAELLAFIAELQHASAALRVHTPDGPCDDRCGCVTATAAEPTLVQSTAETAAASRPPVACSLDPRAAGDRMREWQELLTLVRARLPVDGGIRLEFSAGTPVEAVASLAVAEQACCSFFSFALTLDARGLGLEVRAPEDAYPVLAGLFGAAR